MFVNIFAQGLSGRVILLSGIVPLLVDEGLCVFFARRETRKFFNVYIFIYGLYIFERSIFEREFAGQRT